MSFTEEDIVYSIKYMHNYLNTADDLIKFWLRYGKVLTEYPSVEKISPWLKAFEV